MSLSWKLLPFAAMAVLGAFALLPGGAARPTTANAAFECGNTGVNMIITITDDDTGDPLVIAGAVVEVDPDPVDGSGSPNWTDNSDADQDDAIGVIELEDICTTDAADEYDINLVSLPGVLSECDEVTESVTVDAPEEDGGDVEAELVVDCEDVNITTPVPTTGAAATVVAQASPSTVNCNGTSIVTIQVKTAGGTPVAVGTAVTIQASIGSVSPSSGQTTSADGSVFVFYTAPSNAGGAATITARAGNAQGTATVTVNCAAAAPTATTAPSAPPPTVNPGSISPPNTGDAGIASDRTDWTPFAGIAVIVATLIGGAVAAVKARE
jgi:hypothetical protein